MSVIAIVPARGGSKGIPRKNLRPLRGRPLLACALEAADASRYVEATVVSTDDAEIAALARRWGAEVVERPSELSGDEASSEDTLLHALDEWQRRHDRFPELLVFLQCTAPLLTPEHIDGTVDALLSQEADCAFAAVPFRHFLWRLDETGVVRAVNHDPGRRQRRQERFGDLLEAGSVYVMRAEGFRKNRNRFFGRVVPLVVDESHWLEIDEPPDLELAEILLAEREQRAAAEHLPSPVEALLLDFDGVLTDNRVLVTEDGREGVHCHRGDGFGIERLRGYPVAVAVLSREQNPVVAARCRKLGIEHRQGLDDKVSVLDAWLAERGLSARGTIYVGNDVNDLGCMERVGCPVAVADAEPEVKRAARIVLSRAGGRGAVRELIDLIIGTMESQS